MRTREDERPVVAGYDGSKTSTQALRWAVDEARRRFVPLVVCHAWQWPYPVPPVNPETLEAVRRMGQHVLDRGVSLVQDLAPRLEVRGELVTGSASIVLRAESAAAELLVVGQRGAGGFEELQIGSTAMQLAAHASCPVTVVKENIRPRTDRIVVGVEGTHPERAEIGVAFEEARLRHATLTVFCLCPAGTEETRPLTTRFYATVAVWEEKYPEIVVETVIETRPYTAMLRQAADSADLAVIGDRGDDDPVELPLGLVCQALLRGAPCAVTVVPSRPSISSSR